jgi:rhodanese-related sulfurtransferase
MRKAVWLLCCGLALSACGQNTEVAPDEVETITDTNAEVVYRNITPAEAQQLIQNEQTIVLDVRTEDEYQGGHLENARNMDVLKEGFEASLTSLDKTATYLVYCKSGGRSARAMSVMQEHGFQVVYNMDGGITAWNASANPTVQ